MALMWRLYYTNQPYMSTMSTVKTDNPVGFLPYFFFPTFLRETINLFEYFFGVRDF